MKPRICQYEFHGGHMDSHGVWTDRCDRLGRPYWMPWGDIQWLCFDHSFSLQSLTRDEITVLEVMTS